MNSEKLLTDVIKPFTSDERKALELLFRRTSSFTPLKVLNTEDSYVDEVVFECDIDGACYFITRRTSQAGSAVNLSPREFQIARLVAEGLPNKQISNQLGISAATVSTYLRRMFAKLRVSSRAAMIAQLSKVGLLY
jgi:two-component system, NarL family, nitrate/nitrite response regulator NarL